MDASTLASTRHAESLGVPGALAIPEHPGFYFHSRGRSSLRRLAFLSACALVALAGCASEGSGDSSASASAQASPRQMNGVFEPLIAQSALEDPHERVCADLSLPINTSEVFGSSTHNPNDLYSYKPAILTPQGARDLSADLLREDGNYIEPLDGTQKGPWITFLGRQVSSSSTGDHQEDNVFAPWTIYSWNRDEQRLHTVMTWSDLPAHSPRSSGELPPVSDGTHAFYGAKASTDHGDFSLILAQGLDDSTRSDKPQILLFGAYPAVSEQGLSVVATTKDSPLPSRVATLSGTDFSAVTTHFDLKSQDYRIRGLYAAGGHHAVLVTPSSTSSEASSFLGLWDSTSADYPTQWIMVDSRTPWVSIGEEAIAWGAGSQANNAQMYLRPWETGQITRLGETPGYSRPVVAASGHTLMIPHVNSQGGIQWSIGEFTAE